MAASNFVQTTVKASIFSSQLNLRSVKLEAVQRVRLVFGLNREAVGKMCWSIPLLRIPSDVFH